MSETKHTCAFVLGAVFDFVLHCVNRDMPMVVGRGYPRDKFIEEFEAWAKQRTLSLNKIDIDGFRLACESKLLT